jgi:hypothetical protein
MHITAMTYQGLIDLDLVQIRFIVSSPVTFGAFLVVKSEQAARPIRLVWVICSLCFNRFFHSRGSIAERILVCAFWQYDLAKREAASIDMKIASGHLIGTPDPLPGNSLHPAQTHIAIRYRAYRTPAEGERVLLCLAKSVRRP